MKSIFIPVDFSEQSLLSCKFAFHAFGNEEIKITFFHSYFDQLALAESHLTTDLEPNMIGLMDERIFTDLKENSEKELQNLKDETLLMAKAMNLKNISIETKTEGGLPFNEVLHNLKKGNYDLIIVGSKKDHQNRVGGNNFQARLINKSMIPVVVVPPEYTGESVSNIIYLTEFNIVDIENIYLLDKFFPNQEQNIHIIHFVEVKTENSDEKMNSLKHAFIENKINTRLKFSIQNESNVIGCLEQFIAEEKVSFIAFMPHKNSFGHLFEHKLVNKKKLLHLSVPIISIPMDKKASN
ncbi:MAG: universal stress protein [Bacteroidales bacterium]